MKKDSKRELILDAAIKVIAEKGFQYATTVEIAKRAGVAKGLIHFYFENKLDVLLSVILLFWQEINSANRKRLTQYTSPVDRLKAVFVTFQELLLRDERSLYWGKVLNEGLPQLHSIKSDSLQKKMQAIKRENKKLTNTIDTLIKEGQEQGVINAAVKPQVLRLILGGASQMLTYGMYLDLFPKGKIGFNADDVRESMDMLIDKFTTTLSVKGEI